MNHIFVPLNLLLVLLMSVKLSQPIHWHWYSILLYILVLKHLEISFFFLYLYTLQLNRWKDYVLVLFKDDRSENYKLNVTVERFDIQRSEVKYTNYKIAKKGNAVGPDGVYPQIVLHKHNSHADLLSSEQELFHINCYI